MLTRDQTVAALNEWMREFTEDPEKFEQSVTTAKRFMSEVAAGETPTYGQSVMALLEEYNARLTAPDTSLPSPTPSPAAVPA